MGRHLYTHWTKYWHHLLCDHLPPDELLPGTRWSILEKPDYDVAHILHMAIRKYQWKRSLKIFWSAQDSLENQEDITLFRNCHVWNPVPPHFRTDIKVQAAAKEGWSWIPGGVAWRHRAQKIAIVDDILTACLKASEKAVVRKPIIWIAWHGIHEGWLKSAL